MEVREVGTSARLRRAFLGLPRRLYGQRTITQSREDEEQLLAGTHWLSPHLTLTAFVVLEAGRALGRCAVTEYAGDDACYFGFFECMENQQAFDLLMNHVERFAASRGWRVLEGPLDASLWLGYRFKADHFERAPYVGEPYNKAYYLPLFHQRGYAAKETYVSNQYGALPREGFESPKARLRWEQFRGRGYEIRSPRADEWDQSISAIYDMIAVLYTNFETYHPISREEFVGAYDSYRTLCDLSLIKIAYLKGEPVGFLMGVPDYGNLASRRKTPATILRFLATRRRPNQFVLLYMGVMGPHRGIGLALVHAVMGELAQRGTPCVGALIREGNINNGYAGEHMVAQYRYEFLARELGTGAAVGGDARTNAGTGTAEGTGASQGAAS